MIYKFLILKCLNVFGVYIILRNEHFENSKDLKDNRNFDLEYSNYAEESENSKDIEGTEGHEAPSDFENPNDMKNIETPNDL